MTVVVLVDPAVGSDGEARAKERVVELAAESHRLGGREIIVAAATRGNFAQSQPERWRDEWRTTAITLLPRYKASLLVVFLAEERPAIDGLPFDNLAVVYDRRQSQVRELLTAWGVPPGTDASSPPVQEWLRAAADFPLDGGLTSWTPAKTTALQKLAAEIDKPLGREKIFPLEIAGRALMTVNQPERAAEVFALAAGQDDRLLRLPLLQSAALRQAHKAKDALALVQPLLPKHPADVDLISEVALCQLELGQRSEAEQTLRAGIARVPQSAILKANLGGVIIEQLGRRAEGLALLQEAVKLDPSNPTAMNNLHAARGMERALVGEAERLKRLVGVAPTGENWRRLGVAWARVGRLDQAEEALRRAKALLPGSDEVAKDLQTVMELSPPK